MRVLRQAKNIGPSKQQKIVLPTEDGGICACIDSARQNAMRGGLRRVYKYSEVCIPYPYDESHECFRKLKRESDFLLRDYFCGLADLFYSLRHRIFKLINAFSCNCGDREQVQSFFFTVAL